MTTLFKSALTLILLASASVAAQASPLLVGASFNKLYVPNGFDSNDSVQFMAEGAFRNTCYRPAPANVSIINETKEIYVGPVAYEYPGLCLQIVLPFHRVIEVGILPAGQWQILQGTPGLAQPIGTLTVRDSRSENADDFLYAPITQAFFKQKGDKAEVALAGEFNSDCMTLETVRVEVQKDVIIVQPIVAMNRHMICNSGTFPFQRTVKIETIAKGRYLLHVRSMNGTAINTLVQMN